VLNDALLGVTAFMSFRHKCGRMGTRRAY